MGCSTIAGAIARLTVAAFPLFGLAACGGGGSSIPPPTYSIGGTLSGIGAGQSVVLHDNGGDDLTVTAVGTFTFAAKVTSGGTYLITATAPVGTTCMVTGSSGTASADVTTVVVNCVSDATYSIGGSVSHLVGQGLTLELSGQDDDRLIEISRDGNFVFAPHPESATGYVLSVKQQPSSPRQQCFVEGGTSLPGGADATDVRVVCGEFAYVTNAADNTVSAFLIDPATGALTSVESGVTAGQSPRVIVGTRGGNYIYVLNAGGSDVSEFAVDPVSGNLSAVPGSPIAAGTGPSGLALDSGFLADYEPRNQRQRTYVYIANAGSDTVSAYDGRSTIPRPLAPASYPTGAGPSVLAQYKEFLYTANSGASSDISGFAVDDFSTGALKPIAGSPFSSGSSVKSLTFSGDGKYLYGCNVTGGTAAIYGFSVDPQTGALTNLSGFPYPLPSCTYVAFDRSGTHLYATAGTNITGYDIDAQTGTLKPLTGFPLTVGGDVQSVSIDPTNQFLYVANGSTGTVTGFSLNELTGSLTAMPGSPFVVGSSADFIATF